MCRKKADRTKPGLLTFKNLEASVSEDVQRIKNHPLVAKDIPVYGYIYDVKSGKLIEVPQTN